MVRNHYSSLHEAITDIFGSSRTIVSRQSVSGGDINESYVINLDDGTTLFLKTNSINSFFDAEAEGLNAIRKTNTVRVPTVLGLGVDSGMSFLLMEFISSSGQRIKGYWETFAEELSAMHNTDVGSTYGFPHDNWIGTRKQKNTFFDSWIDFFRDCRLKPQFDAATNYFSVDEMRKMDWLLEHLDLYLFEPVKPSLVHGDLWSGNMITGSDGKGWLIDPAVYYGCSEVDIAMTELFGGFSYHFYDVYKQTMEPGYEDRRELYNLYHLLNHLNIFGSGYLQPVVRIIERYGHLNK